MDREQLITRFSDFGLPKQLSTDQEGRQLVFQIRRIKEDMVRDEIYLWDGSARQPKFLCQGSEPQLSPDGKKLALIQEGQLAVLEMESRRLLLTVSGCRIGEMSWSPENEQLVYSAAVPEPSRLPGLPKLETSRWIERTKFKEDEVGISDGTYRQIFLAAFVEAFPRQLTFGPSDKRLPMFCGRGVVAYTAVLKDTDVSDFASVILKELETGEEYDFPGPGGPIEAIAAIEDGKRLLLVSHDNSSWEATNYQLYGLDLRDGGMSSLTQSLDRTMGNVVLNDFGLKSKRFALSKRPGRDAVLAKVTDGFATKLYEITGQGEITLLKEGREVITDAAELKEGLVWISSAPDMPARVVLKEPQGRESLLFEQEPGELLVSEPVEFSFPDEKGRLLTALYYPARGRERGLILDIHGGPHYCHGYCFSYDVQLRASQGYASLLCNPAGSQGAGEQLARESYHDWGGKDYRDLLACMYAAVKQFDLQGLPWAVMGGSYGGFMTNWMITHNQLFRCAISERSTCNRYSQAGTSDCAFRYGKFEFDGFAWENPGHYMEHSPISYVKRVGTPVLLIHGDADMNCPVSQSEEFYSALKMEGKEAYLVEIPGEYHSFGAEGSPACRRDRYRLMLWWLDRYLKEADGGK